MASLADIPERYMDKRLHAPFIDWLFSIPLPAHTRQELCQLWCYHTGADPAMVFALLNTRQIGGTSVSTQ